MENYSKSRKLDTVKNYKDARQRDLIKILKMENLPKKKERLTNDFYLSLTGDWEGGILFQNRMIQNGNFRNIGLLTYLMTCYVNLQFQIKKRNREIISAVILLSAYKY